MAHIIAFMDDTLHAGTRGSAPPRGMGLKRQADVTQQRRAVQVAPSGVEREMDAPVRMDRVDALRASIADGSYTVSASDLADKILHTMLQR